MTANLKTRAGRVRAGLRSRGDARLPAFQLDPDAADRRTRLAASRPLRPLAGDGALSAHDEGRLSRRRMPAATARCSCSGSTSRRASWSRLEWPASLAPLQTQLAVLSESSRSTEPTRGRRRWCFARCAAMVWAVGSGDGHPDAAVARQPVVTGPLPQCARTCAPRRHWPTPSSSSMRTTSRPRCCRRWRSSTSSATGDGVDYQMAVVSAPPRRRCITASSSSRRTVGDAGREGGYVPGAAAGIRPSIAEVRRFTTFTARIDSARRACRRRPRPEDVAAQTLKPQSAGSLRDARQPHRCRSCVQQDSVDVDRGRPVRPGSRAATRSHGDPPQWRLLVKHPSGSLEHGRERASAAAT